MPTKHIILLDRIVQSISGSTLTRATTAIGGAKTISEAYDIIENEIERIKQSKIILESYKRCNIKTIRFRITDMEYPNWPSLDDVIITEVTNADGKY